MGIFKMFAYLAILCVWVLTTSIIGYHAFISLVLTNSQSLHIYLVATIMVNVACVVFFIAHRSPIKTEIH